MADAQPSDSKAPRSGNFWRACGFLYPYRAQVAIALASAFISAGLTTVGLSTMYPLIYVLTGDKPSARPVQDMLQQKIDAAVAAHGHAPWYLQQLQPWAEHLPTKPVQIIMVFFLIVLAFGVTGNLFRFFHEFLSDKCAISSVNDVRRKLYDHVLHLPVPYFGSYGTSDVTSRMVSDAQQLQEGFKTFLGPAVAEPIKAAFALLVAAVIDWRLTVFIIIFAPVSMTVIRKFGKKVRRASRAALRTSSNMLGQIESTLVGIRVVKSAGAERFERRRYSTIMAELNSDQIKMARYEAISTPVLETLGALAMGTVLIVASFMIFEWHSLDKSGFLMLLMCLVAIGESMRRTSKLNTVLQKSNAAAGRVFELLDTPVESRRPSSQREGNVVLRGLEREITFQKINFQYPGTQFAAVSDLSLTVKKGQSIAIVGRNGSGKTTLLSLLPRFFEPSSGVIQIDGTDIRDFTLPSLRKNIGIVTQDAVIFPGTIADNIAYGQPALSRDEIESAAKQAFAHDFIMQKPNGYETRLEGLGGQLSGGQKQRINIARAILRKTPILILDEATSQVDAESEHLIQQAIEQLMHQRTTFVIAHRFSTILAADTIVVMEQGRVVGQGKHEELLQTCETYKQLYERQLVGAG